MGESEDLGGLDHSLFWVVVDYCKGTYGLTEEEAMIYAIGSVFKKYATLASKERGQA